MNDDRDSEARPTGLPTTGGEGRGVQAYRWIVMGGMGLISLLSMRVLDKVDKTSDKVDALQVQVVGLSSTAESRFNAHADRLRTIDDRNIQQDQRMDRQDVKIDLLRDRVLQGFSPAPAAPMPRPVEQEQRQQWERK